MPTTRPAHRAAPSRTLRHAAATTLAAPFLLALIGCAGGTPPPTIDDAPYAGPQTTLDSQGPEHVAVFRAPTAGFSPSLDQADLGFRTRVAYVTIRRPDPAFVYPQAVVDQRVSLGVDSREPIRLYVRLIDVREKPARQPYALAATSPGLQPGPTPTPRPTPTPTSP